MLRKRVKNLNWDTQHYSSPLVEEVDLPEYEAPWGAIVRDPLCKGSIRVRSILSHLRVYYFFTVECDGSLCHASMCDC